MFAKALVGAAIAAAVAAPALGQDIYGTPGAEMWQQGGWYAGGGYRSNFFKIPGFGTSTTDVGTNTVQFRHFFGRLTDFGGTGRLGYALRDGSLPAWLGRNIRIDLFGGYGVSNASGSSLGPVAGIFNTTSVSGATTVISGIRIGTTVASAARVSQRAWQVGLRASSDFDLWGDSLVFFSPSIAVFGGNQDRKFALNETFGTGAVYTMAAKLDTDEIGGQLGGKFTWRLNWWLAVHSGVHVTLAHRRSSLAASDCFGAGPVCNGAAFVTSASDRRSTFVAVPGADFGMLFSAGGPFVLGLSGGLDYDYRNPGIRLPNAGDTRPASIIFNNALNFNVQAKFVVKLN